MRSFLPFAALLGVALVLGCQDLAPVGPDGLVPQFGKGGIKGKPPPVLVDFLTLADGMETDENLPVILSGFNAAQNNDFSQEIVMNFRIDKDTPYGLGYCEIIRGANGVHHAPDIEELYENLLLGELSGTNATVERGKFNMYIDPTGLVAPDPDPADPASTPHFIDVRYDHAEGDAFIVLGGGDGPTVRWLSHSETQDEFEFRGPVKVGIKGVTGERGKKSNRTIRCGGANNAVTVTVTRPTT